MEFKNLHELKLYFNNELVCMEFLEKEFWNGTPVCPHCGSEHHYRVKTRFKHPDLKDYKDFFCKCCRKKYSVLTGTIYESTKISLQKWFQVAHILASHKKGISSKQVARDIGITEKSAWFMLHRLRSAMVEVAPEMVKGVVLADESFIGGKNKNRHKDKKVKYSQGRSYKDKTPVAGVLQHDGPLILRVIPDTKSESLHPLILEHVQKGSTLYTDEWIGYNGLNKYYDHQVVDHGRGQYANGVCSTNKLEGAWAHLKRSLSGIYHSVRRKHLQRYCDEFAFRYNRRLLKDVEKFHNLIRQCIGRRLLYKVLIS